MFLQHFPMDVIGGTIIGVMLAGVMANRTKLYQIFEKSKILIYLKMNYLSIQLQNVYHHDSMSNI